MITALVTALLLQGVGKLQIKDTAVGTGRAVMAGDLVTVDYTGKLTNGKQFDSSVGKATFTFKVGAGNVIKGWDKGLVGMKVGGKRHLTIPSAMAYGDNGAGEIPPKATLAFDIKLYSIERAGDKAHVSIKTTRQGIGPAAKNGDTVTLHYKGTFLNGTKFDSSYDRNQPFPVTLGSGGVIKGFEQGIMGIKKGEKRKVTIPSSLAYGERGAGGGQIPANTPLIFELEAISISHSK